MTTTHSVHGTTCHDTGQPTVLYFSPVARQPYMFNAQCEVCGAEWTHVGHPQEYAHDHADVTVVEHTPQHPDQCECGSFTCGNLHDGESLEYLS